MNQRGKWDWRLYCLLGSFGYRVGFLWNKWLPYKRFLVYKGCWENPTTPQIAYRVAICPRGNLPYIRNYPINNTVFNHIYPVGSWIYLPYKWFYPITGYPINGLLLPQLPYLDIEFTDKPKIEPLTIKQVQGPLALCALPLIVATLVFLVETCLGRRKGRVIKKMAWVD